MTAPERFADSQIPLAPRAPSIHDPLGHCAHRTRNSLRNCRSRRSRYSALRACRPCSGVAIELRPRCIDRRFSLRSIRQRLGDNVAHHDQTVLPHQLCGLDMQVVSTRIGDFGVNSPYAFLVAGALRLGQPVLVFLEVPRIFDLAAVGQRGQCDQAEIDATPAPQVWLSAISTCRLRYQRPRASCAKHPVLILPSTGRLRQSR